MVFEFCVWDWRAWDGACEESKGRLKDWEINGNRIREDNVNWTAFIMCRVVLCPHISGMSPTHWP
jgi:hypothetical protein